MKIHQTSSVNQTSLNEIWSTILRAMKTPHTPSEEHAAVISDAAIATEISNSAAVNKGAAFKIMNSHRESTDLRCIIKADVNKNAGSEVADIRPFPFSISKQNFRPISHFFSVPQSRSKSSIHTHLAFQHVKANYQPMLTSLFSTSKQNFSQYSYFSSFPKAKPNVQFIHTWPFSTVKQNFSLSLHSNFLQFPKAIPNLQHIHILYFSIFPQNKTKPSVHMYFFFQHRAKLQSTITFLLNSPKTKPSFQFLLTKAVPFSVLKSNISRCSNSHSFPHLEAKLQPLFIFLFST